MSYLNSKLLQIKELWFQVKWERKKERMKEKNACIYDKILNTILRILRIPQISSVTHLWHFRTNLFFQVVVARGPLSPKEQGKRTWTHQSLIVFFSSLQYPLVSSIKCHGHAGLVNMSLLCAIYWHHITWFVDIIRFFQNSSLDGTPCKMASCSFNICLEKRLNCSTQTHTDNEDGVHTEKWSGALLLKTDNNGRRGGERETHRQRDHPFFFLYRIPFSPLTLLGLTALCRFSIHLSLSAAERHAKHLVPDAVVTWGYSQW